MNVVRDIVYGEDARRIEAIEGHDFQKDMRPIIISRILAE